MTREQHLENIRTICGKKDRIEAFDWFGTVIDKWCEKYEETQSCVDFVTVIWDYLTKEREWEEPEI